MHTRRFYLYCSLIPLEIFDLNQILLIEILWVLDSKEFKSRAQRFEMEDVVRILREGRLSPSTHCPWVGRKHEWWEPTTPSRSDAVTDFPNNVTGLFRGGWNQRTFYGRSRTKGFKLRSPSTSNLNLNEPAVVHILIHRTMSWPASCLANKYRSGRVPRVAEFMTRYRMTRVRHF